MTTKTKNETQEQTNQNQTANNDEKFCGSTVSFLKRLLQDHQQNKSKSNSNLETNSNSDYHKISSVANANQNLVQRETTQNEKNKEEIAKSKQENNANEVVEFSNAKFHTTLTSEQSSESKLSEPTFSSSFSSPSSKKRVYGVWLSPEDRREIKKQVFVLL
jgi:hypothetical protein